MESTCRSLKKLGTLRFQKRERPIINHKSQNFRSLTHPQSCVAPHRSAASFRPKGPPSSPFLHGCLPPRPNPWARPNRGARSWGSVPARCTEAPQSDSPCLETVHGETVGPHGLYATDLLNKSFFIWSCPVVHLCCHCFHCFQKGSRHVRRPIF